MNDHELFHGFNETTSENDTTVTWSTKNDSLVTFMLIEQVTRLTKRRLEDARVQYRHYRACGKRILRDHEWKEMGLTPDAKGGATLAYVEWPDGYRVVGQATCSSKDNFNKALGRKIAVGRALSQVQS